MADVSPDRAMLQAIGRLFRAHPWHGIAIGDNAPHLVTVYIELVPSDTLKYELDKASGHLKIDRPQRYSSLCPAPYGFIPQTLCAEHVGELGARRTGRHGLLGDGDPLDICVLTEKAIDHGDVLLQAIPIGGLRMIDHAQVDDKIVAVLKGDMIYGGYGDVAACPQPVIERLKHYFLTYKQDPDAAEHSVEITDIYGAAEAYEVIERSRQDYRTHYGELEGLLASRL